jgi:hypothetical protein
MTNEIRIYVEGGGDSKDGKAFLRQGLGTFLSGLRESARQKKIRWAIVACGPRDRAFEDFKIALDTHDGAFNILLVDSEATVQSTPWQHLRTRDGWTKPDAEDENCHLMVQEMEAWFIADLPSLSAFYGRNFNAKSIPGGNVESVSKQSLNDGLRDATRDTQKGEYHKIRHGCKLLEVIDAAAVRQASPHCNRLFATLESKISE